MRETPADAGWGASLGAVLAGIAPVAAIGARAARLLDIATVGTESPDRGGPRFATLADCALATPGARAADAALLTLDALDPEVRARAPAGAAAADREGRTDALDRALGVACRLFPARLLLLVGADEAPSPETLFAFGFRRLVIRPDGMLHEYRLHDYKVPPDWLNARYWANPERFALDAGDEVEEDDEADEDDEAEEDDEADD